MLALLSLSWYIFLRLRRAAHHLYTVHHLGGGHCSSLDASTRHAHARIERVYRESSRPRAPSSSSGISATSSSFGRGARGAEHRMALSAIAALAIAALANICSAFWLLVCRCTARCWDSVHGPSPALLCAAGLCRRLLSVCTHGSVSCELDALIMP